jgi:hypothetical protein
MEWKRGKTAKRKDRSGSGTASQRVKNMKYNCRSNQVRLKVKRVLLEWFDHVLAEVEGRSQPILGYLDGPDLLVPSLQNTKGAIRKRKAQSAETVGGSSLTNRSTDSKTRS